MRIICPNCGAQYEVDPRVIPDVGRDVQCSNCGHTWFQRPQSAVAASVRRVVEDPPVSPGPEDDLPGGVPDAAGARAADVFPAIAGDEARDGAADETAAAADAEPDVADRVPDAGEAYPSVTPAPHPAADAPAAVPPPVAADDRPVLDEATRALLREEAEREARARAAERRPAVEVQGDFGLAPPAAGMAAAASAAASAAAVTVFPGGRPAQRMADLGGDAAGVSPVATALAAAASRRDSLPDVDSISSSLRGGAADAEDTDTAGDAAAEVPERRFRSGFLLVLLLVIAASVVYLYAPALADAVPGLRAPLAAYVAAVNDLRAAITGALSGLAGMLTGAEG